MSRCYGINVAWPGLFLMTAWIAVNAFIFCTTFLNFVQKDELIYLFSIVGYPISFSKGAAEALNFNCTLILLPVCKNIISLLRSACHLKCSGPNVIRRQLDYNILFHKLVGYSICFWTAVHYIGHSFNIERFIEANSEENGLIHSLNELPKRANGSWVNPIKTNETLSVREVLIMIPGWSGLIATIILVVMVASSTGALRRRFHEVFWYTHHLFVLFFVFIIIHGIGGVVRSQTNSQQHNPRTCSNTSDSWGISSECPLPEFTSQPPHTWMWVVGPLILYTIECLVKLFNRFIRVEIVEARIHTSDVLELKMKKRGFRSNAGQYITVMCPSISCLQWHPFTLTSAPDDDHFSIHIKAHGDWTKDLLVKFRGAVERPEQNGRIKYPRISVDGPYGTCCEDIFQYKVVMLAGGGIGVTPYISVLRHIWHLHRKGGNIGLQKIYFYWVCRDQTFKWFNQMLRELEEETEKANDNFISIKIFWSQGWNSDLQKQILENIDVREDVVTDLKSRTHFGRPVWSQLFGEVQRAHSDCEIGVFCCGSKSLSKCLKVQCINHTNVFPMAKPRFVFHKENF